MDENASYTYDDSKILSLLNFLDSTIILQEELDENYEPTEEEILEYANYLGMKFPEDEDLLYIAKEGLKAPLPDPWRPCKTSKDEIYYFNFTTGESIWQHPCDQYYKKQFQTAKQNKLNKKNQKKKHQQQQQKGISANPADPINFLGNPQSEKLKNELLKLDEEFGLKYAEYEKEKEFELKDLENELEEELSIDIETDEQLVKYNTQMNIQNTKATNEKKEEIEKEMKENVLKMSKQYEEKKKEDELELKKQFEQKKREIEEEYESKQKNDLEKIQLTTKHKIDLEKKKIDEAQRKLEKEAANNYSILSDLKSEYADKIEEKKNQLLKEAEQEQQELKGDLQTRRQSEKLKIEAEDEKRLQNELTKLKVEENYKKMNEESSLKELEEQYKMKLEESKKYINDKIDESFVLMKKKNEEALKNKRIILQHKIKSELEKEKNDHKFNQIKADQELNKLLDDFKIQLQNDLSRQKNEYEDKLQDNFKTLESELQKFTNEFNTSEELTGEIQKIKERNQIMKNYLDDKSEELRHEMASRSQNQAKYDHLKAESQILFNNTSDNLFTLGGSMNAINDYDDENLKRLKDDLEIKEKEFLELKRVIEKEESSSQMKNEDTGLIAPSQSQQPSQIDEIQKATEEINAIKSMLMMKKKGNKRSSQSKSKSMTKTGGGKGRGRGERRLSDGLFSNFQKIHTKEVHTYYDKQSDFLLLDKDLEHGSIKQIVAFVKQETDHIFNEKKRILNELKLMNGLKGGIERNRRDWRKDLYNYHISSKRKLVVETMKSKMDFQAEVLEKQIEDIKYEDEFDKNLCRMSLRNNEKKSEFIKGIERKIEIYRNSLLNKDYEHLAHKMQKELEKEYNFYIKVYKSHHDKEQYNKEFIFDLPSFGKLLAKEQSNFTKYADPLPKSAFDEEDDEFFFKPKKNKSFGGAYQKTIHEYQKQMKNIQHRDIINLAKNSDRMMKLYAEQSDWLYHMKSEVSKSSFNLNKPFY